ncbi:hypothetical protein CONPUDRAFT_160892 [Coniophora puteana RWD-64-598 SS2]|uniref:F-box domain-containing protein n=1 Tax=Coniophora puteana (strain RWD-64-598) TaxID=741705 RepID=A0A5M3N4L6_CONPW|nr:uncharacterized protein CONPUDRAFT_160892 [Coniophora puteana RWD-64-598 SS2]EIW85994.1 hypothetical protein CONPUDRAFT_160892 [Coniophora puteana RWD-64-598 SS2]
MHNALALLEILDQIFMHVVSRDTLGVLARTCKAFERSALDRLWSGDPWPIGTDALLCVLSQFLVKDEKGNIAGAKVDVEVPEQDSEDWDRIFRFTSRICGFSLRPAYIDPSALVTFVRHPSSVEKIFPKLRSLKICGTEVEFINACMEFIHPHLLSLTVSCHPDLLPVALDAIPKRCPRLHSLILSLEFLSLYSSTDPPLVQAVTTAVAQLPSITVLKCPDLDLDELHTILPHIRFQRLTIENMGEPRPRAIQGPNSGVPSNGYSIESIGLSSSCLSFTLPLFSNLQGSPKSLNLSGPDNDDDPSQDPEYVRALIRLTIASIWALSDLCPSLLLLKLRISASGLDLEKDIER